MKNKNYSAGAVKFSFWFFEFRKVIGLLHEGRSLDEIKAMNKEQNIFLAPTSARATMIFNTVSKRIQALPETFLSLFKDSDISTQKLVNLIAILYTDDLFFDFVYEVYREKLIIGKDTLSDSDFQVFFREKQLQSERVAQWTDETLKRLGGCYKTMLSEAGLIDNSFGSRKILRPIFNPILDDWLKSNNMEQLLCAFMGVR